MSLEIKSKRKEVTKAMSVDQCKRRVLAGWVDGRVVPTMGEIRRIQGCAARLWKTGFGARKWKGERKAKGWLVRESGRKPGENCTHLT